MIKYIDKGNARQHLTDRLMESALNNVGIKADADEVFRDIAENRLPVWIDELQTYDVQEVRRGGWIKDEFGSRCGACGLYAYRDKFDKPWESPYCPICGAKMEGEEE